MKIKTLSLTDFRAFPGPVPAFFEFDGKNLLVYGENGSGKSSLFHALREFFQPTTKSINPFKNKFTEGNGGVCSVDIIFTDGTHATWSGHSLRVLPANKKDDLVAASLRASALDYRALLDTNYLQNFESKPYLTAADNPFASKSPRRINLFKVAVDRLLGGYLVTPLAGVVTQTTIRQLWIEVERQTRYIGESAQVTPAGVNNACLAFNQGLNTALQQLNPFLQPMLNALGHGDLIVKNLNFGGLTAVHNRLLNKRYFDGQTLWLEVSFRTVNPDEPQNFLNEARLSALGLAIYLAGRLALVQSAPLNALKLLVLDDVLIGLDQANRIPVLDALENNFRDWQIVLITHDRLWFETARARSELWGDWTSMELYTSSDPLGYYAPRIEEVGSDAARHQLKQARKHLDAGDRMAACVYARSAFELVLKQMCHSKHAPVAFNLEPRKLDTDDFLAGLTRWAESNSKKVDFDGVFKLLGLYRGTVLNPGSHSTPSSLSGGEVDAAISTLEICTEIQNYGKDAISVAGYFISKTTPKLSELMLACAYLRTAAWRRLRDFAAQRGICWPVGLPMESKDLWAAVRPEMRQIFPLVTQQLDLQSHILFAHLTLREIQAFSKRELNVALNILAISSVSSPTPGQKKWSYAW